MAVAPTRTPDPRGNDGAPDAGVMFLRRGAATPRDAVCCGRVLQFPVTPFKAGPCHAGRLIPSGSLPARVPRVQEEAGGAGGAGVTRSQRAAAIRGGDWTGQGRRAPPYGQCSAARKTESGASSPPEAVSGCTAGRDSGARSPLYGDEATSFMSQRHRDNFHAFTSRGWGQGGLRNETRSTKNKECRRNEKQGQQQGRRRGTGRATHS